MEVSILADGLIHNLLEKIQWQCKEKHQSEFDV